MPRCLLLLLAALALSAAEIPRHVATIPAERTDEGDGGHARTLADPARAGARIVFLGDSITEMWTAEDAGLPVWNRVWKPLQAVNLGVAGDRTEHVLWRLAHGAVDGLDPQVVVLLIGTNNAGQVHEPGGYRCTAAQQADGIRAIVAELQRRCPHAVVLLHAILPRGDDVDPVRPQNEAANALVRPLADGVRVRWIEFGSRFFSPGTTDVSLAWSPDQLHLNTRGYEVWAEVLLPAVRAILDPPARR